MTDKYTYKDIKDEVDFCAHCHDPQEEYRIIVCLMNRAYEEGKKDGGLPWSGFGEAGVIHKLKEEIAFLKFQLEEKQKYIDKIEGYNNDR